MADGSGLTSERLFPDDTAGALARLWGIIREETCGLGLGTVPAFYGGAGCGGPETALPEAVRAPDPGLDGLGHAFLSSLGLSFNLAAVEGWPGASGPVFLDIPKEELQALGADPGIWEDP
jgi:hypothetical protein